MEKRFATFVAIGVFIILSLAVVFFIIYTDSNSTCTSKECVKSASELLTHLDSSIAPCSDFYEFTCGNFLKGAIESESEDLDDYMKRSKTNQIKQMIEEPTNIYDTKTLLKIKSFYSACMNESAIDNSSLKTMKGILRDIGGWPLLERGNWRENYFDWKNATYHLRKIGIDFNVFFNIDVDINKYEPTKHIINIAPGISADFLNFNNDKKMFQEYMMEVATYFGGDKNRAEHDSKEIIEFLNQLKRLNTKGDMKYGDLYNPKTLSQVQYEYPGIYWLDYINGVLYHSASVTSDEVVNIVDPEYIKNFLELLYRTPKRILANFISWRVIQLYISHLPQELRNKSEKYKSFHDKKSRREVCADTVQNEMPQAVEESYVRKYISDDTKRLTKDIIDSIKKEFNKILQDLDWLDDDVKEVAKEKIASTKDYIAYTPEAPSRRKFDLIYDEIKNNEDNFLSYLLEVKLLNLNFKYQKLLEPVFEDEVIEPIYSIKQNVLLLPSYYLQGLFFNENRPQYMNYGAIGTIIAYQLSNLFLEGRRYDLYGNLRQWSTSKSLFNYDTKAKCISEQYKEFYIPGLGKNVNSTLTQEDDVATHFGKKIAYKAYSTWSENHDTEQSLPGLSYTPKQLFWISSAMYECSKRRQDQVLNEMFNRHRSISRLRVLGALRNSKEFAKDFSCPSGSFMNPEDKCFLW